MKDGEKRGKREKSGSDFTMWALKRYGLRIRFELIPKTFEKQCGGDQFTLSLLAPALNECGINDGVIGEVLRDFDIYVGVFAETEASSTERERERERERYKKQGFRWKNLEFWFMDFVRSLGSSKWSVDYFDIVH